MSSRGRSRLPGPSQSVLSRWLGASLLQVTSSLLPLLGKQSWTPLRKEHFISLALWTCLAAAASLDRRRLPCERSLIYLSVGWIWPRRAPGSTFAERVATSSLSRPTSQTVSVAPHPTDDGATHVNKPKPIWIWSPNSRIIPA